MSHSIVMPKESDADKNHADAHQPYKGLIVFCETKLRYEGGIKAWLFLGPYLLGALGLEMIIETRHANAPMGFWPWIGFLAYLILFPIAWRRILKLVSSRKAEPGASTGSAAVQQP